LADQRRLARVGEQIREELTILIDTEIDDPRVGPVTVTHVDLSKDMRNARVWVSGAGSLGERRDTLAGLQSARAFMRSQLGSRMPHLMHTPELIFDYDDSVEHGMRVEGLLSELADDDDSDDD
jgi:ribosome-binding factor A